MTPAFLFTPWIAEFWVVAHTEPAAVVPGVGPAPLVDSVILLNGAVYTVHSVEWGYTGALVRGVIMLVPSERSAAGKPDLFAGVRVPRGM